MTLITYVPAPGYDASEAGVVNSGGGTAFDVHDALTTGGGVITVDTANTPTLASVLDNLPGLIRQGVTPGPTSRIDLIGPAIIHSLRPDRSAAQPNDVLARGSDGLYAPTVPGQTQGVPSSSTPAALSHYLPNPQALQNYKAARLNAAATPCKIMVVGDSIAEGQGATVFANRWVQQFLAKERAKYQPAGIVGGRGYIAAAQGGGNAVTYPLIATPAGAAFLQSGFGLGGRAYKLTGAGQQVTFALNGTSADIVWVGGPTTTSFQWAVDGGAATTVNTVKGAIADFFTTRVALGAAGAHSLVVSWQSGAGVYIDGVIEYNGDENAGIRLYEAGHYGWTSVDYETNLDTPGANGNPLATQIAAVQPHLVVIGLSTNDYLHFLSSAGLSTNLLALIATIRANSTVAPSIVLAPPYLTNYQTFGGHVAPLEPWTNYTAVMNTITDNDAGVTICNNSLRMPPVAGDVLQLYNDNFHPKDKGHAFLADNLSGFLAA